MKKMIIHRNLQEEIEFWGDGSNVKRKGQPFAWEDDGPLFTVHHFGGVRAPGRLRQSWWMQGRFRTGRQVTIRPPQWLFDSFPAKWADPDFMNTWQSGMDLLSRRFATTPTGLRGMAFSCSVNSRVRARTLLATRIARASDRAYTGGRGWTSAGVGTSGNRSEVEQAFPPLARRLQRKQEPSSADLLQEGVQARQVDNQDLAQPDGQRNG